MKKLHKFFALTAMMAMLANTGHSQEYYDGGYAGDDGVAYEEGSGTNYWAVGIPIAALVVAGIIIASTDRHHGSSSSSGSSHYYHSHSSSSF